MLFYLYIGVVIGEVLSFLLFIVFFGFLVMEVVLKYIFEVCDDFGVGFWCCFVDVILLLVVFGIFVGFVFIFVNGFGVVLLLNILGGFGVVNVGLIVM